MPAEGAVHVGRVLSAEIRRRWSRFYGSAVWNSLTRKRKCGSPRRGPACRASSTDDMRPTHGRRPETPVRPPELGRTGEVAVCVHFGWARADVEDVSGRCGVGRHPLGALCRRVLRGTRRPAAARSLTEVGGPARLKKSNSPVQPENGDRNTDRADDDAHDRSF